MSDPTGAQPVQINSQLPPELEIGVFSDFAGVWHTPNTFVLDFLTLKSPPHPPLDAVGQPVAGDPVVEARVAARVRIPSEQIFPLISALQEQGRQWLAETGRSEPPADWIAGGETR